MPFFGDEDWAKIHNASIPQRLEALYNAEVDNSNTWVEVDSPNINRLKYSKSDKELSIEFASGLYIYHDVPEHIYLGLQDATSIGSYYNREIRGKYRYART